MGDLVSLTISLELALLTWVLLGELCLKLVQALTELSNIQSKARRVKNLS